MKYFYDVNTLEQLRSHYKKLLKQYHPDNANGSEDATKAINAEHDRFFKIAAKFVMQTGISFSMRALAIQPAK